MRDTMPEIQTTIAPHTQQPVVERAYPDDEELEAIVISAAEAQKVWAAVPLEERIATGYRFIVSLVASRAG